MIKKILYSGLLGIVLCINMSCNSKKQDTEIEENYPYTLKDYVTKSFKVYEIKADIKPLLDSIIESVNSCSRFKNEQITYSLEIYANLNNIEICVPKYMFYDIWLYRANALFFYKGYQFMYFGDFLDKYFIKTDIVIERNCIKPIEVPPEKICIDDTDLPRSYWLYNYSNNSLKITKLSNCGKSWIDTIYHKVEY